MILNLDSDDNFLTIYKIGCDDKSLIICEYLKDKYNEDFECREASIHGFFGVISGCRTRELHSNNPKIDNYSYQNKNNHPRDVIVSEIPSSDRTRIKRRITKIFNNYGMYPKKINYYPWP